MQEFKSREEILENALDDFDQGSQNDRDNKIRAGTGKALAALTLAVDDVRDQVEKLETTIDNFNRSSTNLQWWLIVWTAVIAVATVVNMLT